MANKDINTVTNASAISSADYIFISKNGANLQKVKADTFSGQQYSNGLLFSNTANISTGAHNSIFRGKSLGTSFTSAQSSEISSGRFTDMFIGDYWTINGHTWRIAAFDPFYRCGDNVDLGHHIAVVPDACLYNAQMHNTEGGAYVAGSEANTTTGGYVSSDMRTTNLAQATTTVETDFGSSHVLSYRDMLTNAVGTYAGTTNVAIGWAWTSCKVELMSETMVYGQKVWANSPYEVGCCCFQLPLFRLAPNFIHIRAYWWLRSVASATSFAYVNSYGLASNASASNPYGVRPLALIA